MTSLTAAIDHDMASPFPGGAPDQFTTTALPTGRASQDYRNATFTGWRRENGRVGVRNHVLILPLDDLSNAACEAVANNVKGTLAIPHAYGRLQFGEDLEIHFRTLIGTGSNPNVAAVVVIGIEDQWTEPRRRRHRQDRQARRRLRHRGPRRHRDDRQGVLRGQEDDAVGFGG